MGCVIGREASSGVINEEKSSRGGGNRKLDGAASGSRGEAVVEAQNGGKEEKGGGGDGVQERQRGERRRSKGKANPRLSNPPRHLRGEQVAAGWPPWLTAVCGEALNGWIPRKADTFEKIDKIGQGTYSNVYKAKDTLTGKIVALKKVRFDNLEPESVKFMAREIIILRRLDHPNVVKLQGLVTSRMSCSLYLVFDYMVHDLAGLAASPGIRFTEPQVKCYMRQLLSGLEHCHHRRVLHRDIKGSNLLIDNEGVLKIADFGLASVFDPNHKHPMTSRVVTLWYRPPELLLGATDYDVGVDLWSAGCILGELLAGKPIMPGRTEVEQLHKIYKLCGSPSDEYWKKSKLPNATLFKPRFIFSQMVGMSDTFNSTDSIECGETGMLKTGFEGSGPPMKKSKLQASTPQNIENSEAAESQDRFDNLPESVVLHILSLMETKDAIRTCVLSKRWRYLWMSVPCLNFNSKSFPRLVEFKRFVLWVLSHRDSSCVKVLIYYRFGVDYATDQYLLDKVIEYVALHGVEEIRINLKAKTSGSPPVKLPLSLFNCKSLNKLELKGCHPTNVSSPHGCRSVEMPHSEQLSMHPATADNANSLASLPELFGFTTLTTLHLNSLTLCYTGNEVLDPFVNCVNLKDLHLSEMSFKSQLIPRDFVISAPRLSNLTLMCNRFKCKLVVNAPQLINFSYLYSTPRAFFEFSIPSLDGLIIDIYELQDRWGNSLQNIVKTSHGLINMCRGHHDIGLSFRTIEDTCVHAAILKQERLSLSKLKSLNLGVGLTYKIFINNLEHITAYFRRCSQHAADFEIVTV